jgi:hypothetical protein
MFMKLLKRYPLLFFLLLSGFFFMYGITSFSCKKDEKKTISSDIIFPDSLVSFINYVEPLFQQTCVISGCHSGSQPAGGLNLESNMWTTLIDHQPSLIIVKNGNESPLVKYLDGRLQPRMPISGTLTTNQINGVKKWIDEGASPL